MTTPQRITKQSQTRDSVIDLIGAPRRRQRDPVGTAAERRSRRLAADRAGCARRARARGLSRAPARQRHVRPRAEDRAGADDDLVQRGHGAGAGCGPASKTLSLTVDARPGPIWAAACTSRRRSGSSSSSGSGSRTARRWRSRRCTCASRSCPGSRRTDLEEHSFYELLAERYGIVIVGGIQTIEPTVTNEEESSALGVPLHSPAFLFERTTRSESGEIVEFVRSIYRGDRYRLVTELSRRDRAGAVPVFVLRDAAMSAARRASDARRRAPLLLSEIREQPAALERLLEHSDEYAAVAALARDRGLNLVRMVGHGSSDNAASYGVYAFGLLPRWTALRDSISLSVYYGAEIDLRGSCVVALSQSGETPDVARLRRARPRARRLHDRDHERSRVGARARRPRPCCRSRPAPSSRSRRRRPTRRRSPRSRSWPATPPGRGRVIADGIRAVAAQLDDALPALERRLAEVAVSLRLRRPDVRDRPRPRVRDRARDLAEAARDVPRRRRAADRHRSRSRPAGGARRPLPGLDDRLGRREPARRARGRRTGSCRGRDAGRERARRARDRRRRASPCRSRAAVTLLSPLLSVVPGQLFAWALAQAKGLDPDRPTGLSKITLAL